jgi:signal transduction histidine kinase
MTREKESSRVTTMINTVANCIRRLVKAFVPPEKFKPSGNPIMDLERLQESLKKNLESLTKTISGIGKFPKAPVPIGAPMTTHEADEKMNIRIVERVETLNKEIEKIIQEAMNAQQSLKQMKSVYKF